MYLFRLQLFINILVQSVGSNYSLQSIKEINSFFFVSFHVVVNGLSEQQPNVSLCVNFKYLSMLGN